MKKVHRISCTLLLLVALPLAVTCLTFQEDDLVFDDVGEDTIVSTPSTSSSFRLTEDRKSERRHNQKSRRNGDVIGKHPVQRYEGVPDTVVPAGHVFKQRIPKQAFLGNVERYEVFEANGGAFPRWIYWDEPASTLLGVPSKRDVGNHHLSVKAFGRHNDVAKDAFLVEVVPERRNEMKHKDGKSHCESGEGQVLMNVFLDATYDHLSPFKKVKAIENLARFLDLHTSAFSIHPHSGKDSSNYDSSTLRFKGPGNVRERKATHQTIIQWQVGCNQHLWKHQENLVLQLHDQAKDGTLAEVLELPVINWRVKADQSSLRNRREAGSGDYDIPEDYDGYDEEYDEDYDDREGGEGDDDNEAITEAPIPSSYVPNSNAEKEENSPGHPHRHHHGEEAIDWNTDELDEHEIVPLIDQHALGSTSNLTTASPSTTTQLISRPSTNTPPSTALPTSNVTTTEVSPTLSSTIKTTTSMTSTTTETAIGPNTTTGATSTESAKAETTEESTERTKHLETEVVTSTSVAENATSTTPSVVTTSRSSTSATSSSTTDKVDIDATVTVTVTTEEPMESTTGTSTRQPTTTTTLSPPPNTSTIITTTPTALPSTTTTFTSSSTHPTTQEITSPSTTATITTSTTQASTSTPSTTTYVPRVTTENIEYGVHNFPPRKDKRLKKIPVTAGKPLSYIIPADTFNDLEDGNTRKLKLSLYLQGAPLKSTHWLQFNSQTQEVYGLPLENDISTWNYELVAADSEGLNVSDRLDIHVQQHKLSRTVNHEFSVYLRIDSRNQFPTDVDWELKVIRSLAELYDDTDTHHITVRSIDIGHDQAIFTWTNDSLPRSSECPQEHIRELLDVLVDENEEPSASLKKVLAPEMTVKRVVYQGIGQCERMNQPEVPKVPTQGPKVNFPPVPRNQVDHVNATVGQLLVFKVPEDTFFDAEDGSSRNMKMSLLSIDRTPIPQYEWLQFDSKNQEFYGVPLRSDIGRKEYQLVVTDRGGASATDGLVVVVHPSPPMHHTVEFSMTLDIPYESFAHSALQKRNFVEKLSELYRDKDTSAISLHSITNGTTVITWHNRTLPTTYCAHEDVNRLRSVLVKSDDVQRSVTDEVLNTMGPKFPVKQITVMPMGICLGELTGVHSPDNYVPPIDDSTSVGAFNDDYLITFVLPAIIIAAMLILAGIIACILYRRRRSGKMSVNEQDDERQSFRSKGIPVIFQDELDEKPDPGNKSPVILKEEKPPLPPPEYQKTEDGADVPMLPKENSEEPYQPPPPFATNRDTNRQNRPKPTPTYRKPPPYVPP